MDASENIASLVEVINIHHTDSYIVLHSSASWKVNMKELLQDARGLQMSFPAVLCLWIVMQSTDVRPGLRHIISVERHHMLLDDVNI